MKWEVAFIRRVRERVTDTWVHVGQAAASIVQRLKAKLKG
jgi:hypothetical protein